MDREVLRPALAGSRWRERGAVYRSARIGPANVGEEPILERLGDLPIRLRDVVEPALALPLDASPSAHGVVCVERPRQRRRRDQDGARLQLGSLVDVGGLLTG